ncbi:11086_t:CDS:2, partial [Funneliformis geosporum]
QTEKKNLYQGLYPAVLEDLSNKRLKLKSCLAPLGKKKQHLRKMITKKALKVYMNTFYRKAGNSKSPIFLHELACGTTITGKNNLNLIAEFISKKEFGIKYGDTDSLYFTCLDRYYEKCDETFFRKELSKEVIKSRTSYLKMAYEK